MRKRKDFTKNVPAHESKTGPCTLTKIGSSNFTKPTNTNSKDKSSVEVAVNPTVYKRSNNNVSAAEIGHRAENRDTLNSHKQEAADNTTKPTVAKKPKKMMHTKARCKTESLPSPDGRGGYTSLVAATRQETENYTTLTTVFPSAQVNVYAVPETPRKHMTLNETHDGNQQLYYNTRDPSCMSEYENA